MTALLNLSGTRRRAAARAAWLLAAVATAAAAGTPEPETGRPGVANYIFEAHYELRQGGARAFDRYWAALRDTSLDRVDGIVRHVDGVDGDTRRIVALPVVRLDQYRAERRNEDLLRAALGVEEAEAIIQGFNDAQVSRTSYLRQYRSDLSVNHARHHRGRAADVSIVTVVEGREAAFERVWRRAADAYRVAAPDDVVSVARTLVGGGPQFVITRPLPSSMLGPAEAVRKAEGERAAQQFADDLRDVVAIWRTERYMNLGLDCLPGGHGDRP